MKTRLLYICFLIVITSCFSVPYEEGPFISPSTNYTLIAKVGFTSPMVHLLVSNQKEQIIDKVDTRASDVQKWAAGWMSHGDTIVLQSSNIGTHAYSMLTGKLQEIDIYSDTVQARAILKRAEQLKELKYNK